MKPGETYNKKIIKIQKLELRDKVEK